MPTCPINAGPVTFSLYIIIKVMLCTKVLSGSTVRLSHPVSLNEIGEIVIKLALILLTTIAAFVQVTVLLECFNLFKGNRVK